jgi:hypothetical protein
VTALPWWAWTIAVIALLFFLVWRARRAFRRAVRGELVAFLRVTRDGFQVV